MDPSLEQEEEDEDEQDEWDPAALMTGLGELRDEMTASTAEWRRGSRRQMDALKEFSTMLQAMGEMMRDIQRQTRPDPAETANSGLPGEWLHILIELHDRAVRTATALATPPAGTASLWPAARVQLNAWHQAWKTWSEAVGMQSAHLLTLLRRAGLQQVAALGQPFDPATMQAVEVAHDPSLPDHQVTAELLPGWTEAATGRLLRPAQVRVSRRQSASAASS
ncbi:MAG: nucleotide exchange factor GrpE [Verrucomicrobiaceae bacterium]|nr:MAG: nucleotide exchange factor GrpE [Verrucomicrobiaceae bacterium]